MNFTSLKDLNLKSSYRTGLGDANPISDFLEPCLAVSDTYDRLSGYFSSRILGLAAEGLADFLSTDGKMRLVMSAQLTPNDFRALSDSLNSNSVDDSRFERLLVDPVTLANSMERDHFAAMCWLLKSGRLEIRIVSYASAEPSNPNPIFHTKSGIFTDSEGNSVSFSGSINETAAGWTGNIEKFRVFKSWLPDSAEAVKDDKEEFEFFWNGGASPEFITLPISEAIKSKLISYAPDDKPNLRTTRSVKPAPRALRDYQIEAIDSWVENNYIGILAMATGTGKTRTARGCIEKVFDLGSTLVVVSAPYQHIAKQWQDELALYSPILAPGNSWKDEIKKASQEKQLGWRTNLVIVGVQNTVAKSTFRDLIVESSSNFENILFVGDEVHGLGATAFQSAMDPIYSKRLGLSATPSRYFDEVGTAKLIDYFDKTVFEFDTAKALNWRDPVTQKRALCDYKYLPNLVDLSHEEMEKYNDFSAQIGKYQGRELTQEEQGILENYLFQRAAVVKTAKSKIQKLRELISPIRTQIKHTLIYCYDMDQLTDVAEVLQSLNITYRKFTGEEGTRPVTDFGGVSERDYILRQFGLGITKVLIAIKCLDEGVDVPAATNAYVLASSGNPREFIQRRGRLLRPHENKDFATIFDFVVLVDDVPDSSITKKEFSRVLKLSADALNAEDIRETFKQYIMTDTEESNG